MPGVDYGAIAAKFGQDVNLNAYRGSSDPIFAGLDPSANWNQYRGSQSGGSASPSVQPVTPTSAGPFGSDSSPYLPSQDNFPPGYQFSDLPYKTNDTRSTNYYGSGDSPYPADWSGYGSSGNPFPFSTGGKSYQQTYDDLVKSGVSAEEAKQTADIMYGQNGNAPTQNGMGGSASQWLTGDSTRDPVRQFVIDTLAKYGRTPTGAGSGPTDIEYYVDRILAEGGLNTGYDWAGRIYRGLTNTQPPEQPRAGAAPPQAAPAMQPSAPQPNPGGYDDPSSMLFLNQAMARLADLNTPRVDPYEQLLQMLALMRAGELGDEPFTTGDDAALIAQYRDPMTQSRDQAKKQKAEDLSRRGFTPTSGLFQSEMGKIDQAYERGIASASNDLGVRAVTERQQRRNQQLDLLSNLVQLSRTSTDRSDARSREALSTAQIFPDFDERRLNMLLGASGEGQTSPGSLISSLTGLGNLGLSTQRLGLEQQQITDANSAANSYAMGQLINAIIKGAAGAF